MNCLERACESFTRWMAEGLWRHIWVLLGYSCFKCSCMYDRQSVSFHRQPTTDRVPRKALYACVSTVLSTVAVLTHWVQPHWFKKLPLPPLCTVYMRLIQYHEGKTHLDRLETKVVSLSSSWCDQINFKRSHLSCCLWSRGTGLRFCPHCLHEPFWFWSSCAHA